MKECNVCGEEQPLSAYHSNKTCADGTVGTCRLCSNTRNRVWYAANRSRRQELENARYHRNKAYWVKRFGNKCDRCRGVFAACVYDFHHVRGKDVNPSKTLSMSRAKQETEMEKCIMLCSNCHRLHHYGWQQ